MAVMLLGSREALEDQDESQALRHSPQQEKAMAGRREDVDLGLLLQDPNVARKWVSEFDWEPFAYPPQYLVHGVDGKIYLNKICDKTAVSDQEAIMAAFMILRGYEMPQVMRERDYLKQINPNLYNL